MHGGNPFNGSFFNAQPVNVCAKPYISYYVSCYGDREKDSWA